MKKSALETPAILLDLDSLEGNIKKYQEAATKAGKQVWPMTKTSKCSEIIKMQLDAGATGCLGGTLDECEAAYNLGVRDIMYAYSVASAPNIKRVLELAKKCNFTLRLDTEACAVQLNEAAEKAGIKINYTIIIDSGLHRFGIPAEEAAAFAQKLSPLKNLVFKGVSTHPGHVYGGRCAEDVPPYVETEKAALNTAVETLRAAGYACEMVTSGSTPTFFGALDDQNITIYHPGNYVFHDVIQMSLGVATEAECALRVYATVVANPHEGFFLIDAGTKCFALDQGAHSSTAIKGYGHVVGHPELTITGLSEEVGKVVADGPTNIKVGDRLEVIPNHSCSTANLTNYFIGTRGDEVERLLEVDLRSNSTKKNV